MGGAKKNTPELPRAFFSGTMKLGDISLDCHVFPVEGSVDMRRVVSERSIAEALAYLAGAAGHIGAGEGALQYPGLSEVAKARLAQRKRVTFIALDGHTEVCGYDVDFFVDILDEYVEAYITRELPLPFYCLALMGGRVLAALCRVGIESLADEGARARRPDAKAESGRGSSPTLARLGRLDSSNN